MQRRLADYIDQHQLFTKEKPVLLAVSGGIDSVVLANLLHKSNYNFAIAHCNFQLRGEASEGDEAFVRLLAASMNKDIFVKSFATSSYAQHHGISIQMAARELRREWFENLIETKGFVKIVTAHHINDSLETAIYNLTKGTGIAGLIGIPPSNELYLRPLMFATRAMIIEYAIENKLEWREDASNESTNYHRNHIRHQVIPALRKINPSIESSFRLTSERIAATTRIYQSAIQKHRDNLLIPYGNGFRLLISMLQSLSESRQIIYEILLPFGFNYTQCSNFILSLGGQSGKCFFSSDYVLTVDREFAFIMPVESNNKWEIKINVEDTSLHLLGQKFHFDLGKRENYEITRENHMAFLDMDKLSFPLTVRAWKEGDRFQPLGMKHKKKLSDFMIDLKIPLTLKEHIPVFLSDDNIIWVAGYRIDERFKITGNTRKIFRISKHEFHV